MSKLFPRLLSASLLIGGACAVNAQIAIGTLDSSDGSLVLGNFTTKTFNLNEAAVSNWDSPAPVAGKGVYDNTYFATVYKFSSLSMVATANINFINRSNGSPVVFLIQGNAVIDGTINLSGVQNTPGPGGFRGGLFGSSTILGSAGGGPGGGQPNLTSGLNAGAGSYATLGTRTNTLSALSGPVYGNDRIIPLIGGSGGGAHQAVNGYGGGGALLLVVRGTLTLNGAIVANGATDNFLSAGAGSGGAVRIICDQLGGTGSISAYCSTNVGTGNVGGLGRIRIERNNGTITGAGTLPAPSYGTAGAVAKVWPDSTDPSLKVHTVGVLGVPADPLGGMNAPDIEVTNEGPFNVVVHATNVPTDSSWSVVLKSGPRNGPYIETPMTLSSGNQSFSVWSASLTFAEGLRTLQARAFKL